MNFMDKIKNEAKSKADRVRKVKAMIEKAGQECSEQRAKSLIKMYDEGNSAAIYEMNNTIQAILDEQDRQATINYLLNHMPLDTLDKEIKSLMASVSEWADKVKGNPEYYLSWGEGAYKDAAKIKVLQTIRHWIDQPDKWDDPGFWPEIEKRIVKYTIDNASSMASSASTTSNLMQSRVTEAWAEAARDSFGSMGVAQVRHWFETKNKVGMILYPKDKE